MVISYTKNIENNTQSITWKKLRYATSTMKLPFSLETAEGKAPIVCEQIIRLVPGKRLVAFGSWGEQEVAVKLFYTKGSAKRDCQKDIFGVEALMHSNVPTPKLLFKGTAEKNRIQILIYEKMVAKSIENIWREKRDLEEVKPLMRAATIELATQHVLGILQHDLHFKNFLVTEQCIYTLDGGKISKFDFPLDKKTSMTYLALFLVQMGAGVEDFQKELFDLYTYSRGWIVKPADKKIFKKMINQNKQNRWQRYDKKIFRTCTAFKRLNKINKTIVYDRSYESLAMIEVLKDPEKIFSFHSTVLLKKGRSSTVAKVEIDNKKYVIKRYNIKNAFHWLRRCLRPTRAFKSWRISQRFFLFGVPTAKPVACIENKFFGLHGKSYFLMEYIEGMNIGEYLSSQQQEEHLQQMTKKIISIFNMLAELYISHGDLKMTNILVENEQPLLIDFDGAKEHLSQSSVRHSLKKDMKRFMHNWQSQPHIFHLFNLLLQDSK